MAILELGPMMSVILDAQQRQADALRYPQISALATEVAELARARSCNLLWPVDLGAHKLAGAIEVVSRGGIEVRSWCTHVEGRSVMLVATVAVSGADLAREAKAARAAGVQAVHGCAIDARCEAAGLDSFTLVRGQAAAVPRSA